MRAQVFSLEAQEAFRRAIARSLRAMYEDVEIEQKVYEDDPVGIGRAYLEALRASAIGTGRFTVEVEDQFGVWSYWDYTADVERAAYFLRLSHEAKTKVFPGVALLNRMVVVPQGIRDALDAPSDFVYLFRPLDLTGVLAVDFGAREAIPNALGRVAVNIRKELVGLARRQMAMYRIPSPDLESLSRLVDVHVEFLEQLRADIETPLPRLAARIVSGPARLNRVSTVDIGVRNESDHPAGLVDVQIRAPFNGVEEPPIRYTDRLDFSAADAGEQTISIDIVPRATPYCPLEVLFLFDEMVDAVTFPIPLIVDVTPP